MNDLVDRLVPAAVRATSAYHVPSAEGLIKLDAMENPWSLPDAVQDAWLERLRGAAFNRYPDPAATELHLAIRTAFDVPDSLGLVLGNGSDELIQMLAQMVGGPGRTFLAPAPSFSMYQLIAEFTGTAFEAVRLEESFEPDQDLFLERIAVTNPTCIFLAYPNNPTGNRFDDLFVNAVIEAAPGLVVIDEAYFAFSGHTWLHRVTAHPNLLVMRTLSKSGLAGLRLGMLFGQRHWTDQIDKIRLPYNINTLSQLSGVFCLEQRALLAEQTEALIENRGWMAAQLGKIDGLTIYSSETNFILVRLTQDAAQVWDALRERGILVRRFGAEPGLENCLRLTVGTRQEIQALIEALRGVLGQLYD